MGLTKTAAVLPLPTMLSPLGKACARMDLTAIHDILLKTGYKDEEGAENEVCQITLFWFHHLSEIFNVLIEIRVHANHCEYHMLSSDCYAMYAMSIN